MEKIFVFYRIKMKYCSWLYKLEFGVWRNTCVTYQWWFWPIRFDVTIVSTGNNCKVNPDWPE